MQNQENLPGVVKNKDYIKENKLKPKENTKNKNKLWFMIYDLWVAYWN